MQIHLLTGGTLAVQKYVQHKAVQKQQVPSDEGTCSYLEQKNSGRELKNTGGEQEMSDQRKIQEGSRK